MPHSTGVTLVELLVTLTILAILTAIAVPSFSNQLNRSRADAVMEELITGLHLARAESISQNSLTTVCPSRDGVACHEDWSQPILMFLDRNNNQQLDLDEKLIRQTSGLRQGEGFHFTQRRNYFQWKPIGIPNGTATSFIYCNERSPEATFRRLTVSFTGRLRAVDITSARADEVSFPCTDL